MAVINTGLTDPGIRAEFLQSLTDAEVQALYTRLATRIPSTTRTESYRWLGSVPQMRAWGSGRQAKGLRSERYDVSSETYEATIEVDKDEIDDDQIGGIRTRIRELAQRATDHKDYLLGQLLINGATSGYNSYDGVTFFNAAHVSGDSGEQSNVLTPEAADATYPTVAEWKAAIAGAIVAMLGFKDDQGLPLRTTPTGLIIVVPPQQLFIALEAIKGDVISSTSNVMKNVAEVVSMPDLVGAPSVWYLLKTTAAVRPFIFQDRLPLEVTSIAAGSEHEFKTGKHLYGVRARYAMAYGRWEYAVKSTFTAS